MKSPSSDRGVTRVLHVTIMASVLSGLLSCFTAFAQPAPESTRAAPSQPGPAATTQPSAEQSLEAWREIMSRIPLPKTGCFTSSYPRTEWQQVPCAPAPPLKPFAPAAGPTPATVGNTNDFSATVSSGSISKAVGSFDNVSNVTSEDDSQFGQGAWSLQLNTNYFSTPACKGANPPPTKSCQGWQQFL
jgi:hypothetical protein